MIYSVDTSALIESWRRRYPPDVFPSIWDGFSQLISSGDMRATEEVLHELERMDDDVLAWAGQQSSLFVEIDQEIQIAVSRILERHPRLLDTRKSRSGADPFVIALAQLGDATVVTTEGATGSDTRPHIPDVCRALGVACITPLDLIRRQGWVFRGS